MRKLLTTTALTLGALTAVAWAAASGTIQYSVAVCDPNSPFRCVAPDASGNMPVTGTITPAPTSGTFTSKNLTLTLGGTAQTLMAANTSRKRIYIQNPCTAAGEGIAAVESIYLSFTGSAGVNNGTSIEILACGSYEMEGTVSTQAISVNAATTGHKIVAGGNVMAINNNPSQPAYLIPGLPSGMGASKGVGTDANGNLQSNDVREVLGANRTYYVATTGSDSNSGLSAGSPFLTIQKAINTIYTLDLNSYTVTVQLADGTYTAGMTFTKPIVGGTVQVIGNTTTPNNVVISTSTANAIYVENYPYTLVFSGMQLTTTGGSNNCLYALNTPSTITLNKVNFGAAGLSHIYGFGNVIINNATNTNYEISGGAFRHVNMQNGAQFSFVLGTVTLTGTPAFSSTFCAAQNRSGAYWYQPVFSGSATGYRYYVTTQSIVNTYGGGATFLPGSLAGIVDTPSYGVYA